MIRNDRIAKRSDQSRGKGNEAKREQKTNKIRAELLDKRETASREKGSLTGFKALFGKAIPSPLGFETEMRVRNLVFIPSQENGRFPPRQFAEQKALY